MLRNDTEVVLNDILVLCESNARQLHHSAGLVQDQAQAALLLDLATQHDAQAEDLRQQLRQLGELPDTVNEDRETLQELRNKITTALSRKGVKHVLDERVQGEAHLAEQVAQATQQQTLPADINRLLEQIGREAATAADRLRTGA